MKQLINRFTTPVKLTFFMLLLSHSNIVYSQFTVNEDSINVICTAKIKSSKGKKLLKGLASASFGIPPSNETTYEENLANFRDNVKNTIIQLASLYDQNKKTIETFKYVSERIILDGDSSIIKLLRRNFKIVDDLAKLKYEKLETSDNKVLLCILNTENQIISNELITFNQRLHPIQMEAQKLERERLANEEREKDLKRQAAKEKFIQEHVEWRKKSKYSFKIEYTTEIFTKECKFCYHECINEQTKFNAPDFKKYGDKEYQHIYLEYLAFLKSNESELGSGNGCYVKGCKESRSGEHTWKAIKTEQKSNFIYFNVGQ